MVHTRFLVRIKVNYDQSLKKITDIAIHNISRLFPQKSICFISLIISINVYSNLFFNYLQLLIDFVYTGNVKAREAFVNAVLDIMDARQLANMKSSESETNWW